MKKTACLLALALLTPCASFAQAQAPDTLVIKGKIQKTNSADKKTLSLRFADLQALGTQTIESKQDYSPDTQFSGTLLKSILKFAQAEPSAKQVVFTGVDGYKVFAPISDFSASDVIIAHTHAGVRMTPQTKGPYWVVYPTVADPKLSKQAQSKMVWNLQSIEVY